MKAKRILATFLSLVILLGLICAPVQVTSLAADEPALLQGANRDGYADLAIGIPYRSTVSTIESGIVGVLYGSNSGLTSTNDQVIDQFTSGVDDTPESYDHFGYRLEAGDFNGDGYVDLAIGVPGEAVNGEPNAGMVQILFGSRSGFSGNGSQSWSHANLTNQSVDENEWFGQALASGDFDMDGFDDLAIGVPGQGLPGFANTGVVNILYGSAGGLSTDRFKVFAQGIGIQETLEINDFFGQVLETGDFNGDRYYDLAISAYNEDLGAAINAGVVQVVYGGPDGLVNAGNQLLYQGNGIQGTPESDDMFGSALAAGDFDDNGCDDLAIGVPFENYSFADDGVVHILWGGHSGLETDFNMLWRQSLISGQAMEANDHFAYSLAAGDFNGDEKDDLAIGVPGQDVAPMANAGVFHILYGAFSGALIDTFHAGIIGSNDQFGYSLAAGDFNGNRYADLAVGAPYDNTNSKTDNGTVTVFYGGDHGLEGGLSQTWNLNTSHGLAIDDDDRFGFALTALNAPHTNLSKIFLPMTRR
ncbi:MAG: hypothetical protein P8074_26490 [Anaerolineales bacterium]